MASGKRGSAWPWATSSASVQPARDPFCVGPLAGHVQRRQRYWHGLAGPGAAEALLAGKCYWLGGRCRVPKALDQLALAGGESWPQRPYAIRRHGHQLRTLVRAAGAHFEPARVIVDGVRTLPELPQDHPGHPGCQALIGASKESRAPSRIALRSVRARVRSARRQDSMRERLTSRLRATRVHWWTGWRPFSTIGMLKRRMHREPIRSPASVCGFSMPNWEP